MGEVDVNAFSSSLQYVGDGLCVEECEIDALAAEFGTPLFIYSRAHIVKQFNDLATAIDGTDCHIHYAVKANSNLSVLRLLTELNSGFDVVSGGELRRALLAGAKAEGIMFSGVGKTHEELELAIDQQIGSINIESPAEVEACAEIARKLGKTARVLVRVNPNVDAKTHPYISTGLLENKFGLNEEAAKVALAYAQEQPYLEPHGIACHIGSQLTDTSAFDDALDFMLGFCQRLAAAGIEVRKIDLGGGLGIRYKEDDAQVDLDSYAAVVKRARQALPNVALSIEPGRFIVGNAGVFVSRVINTKVNGNKHFVVVDGAMNDIIRPALYQAHQTIVNTRKGKKGTTKVDVVGPICESADFLAKDRSLHAVAGDNLALLSSGAYCAELGSNYNTRGRAAQVLVNGSQYSLIARRETFEEQVARELI